MTTPSSIARMRSHACWRSNFVLWLFHIVLSAVCATWSTSALAQKKDQKPDAAAAAAQQVQNQEIETVIHAADAAMAAPPATSDIPIQIQMDFLKAQAGRVWIPLTFTIDGGAQRLRETLT